jgi:hypothetical protein
MGLCQKYNLVWKRKWAMQGSIKTNFQCNSTDHADRR